MFNLKFDSVIETPYEDYADDLAEPYERPEESNFGKFLDSLRIITPYALVRRAASENRNKKFSFHSEHNQILVYFNSEEINLNELPKILKGVRQSANLDDCIFIFPSCKLQGFFRQES